MVFPQAYNDYKSTMEKAFTRFDLDKEKLFDVKQSKETATRALTAEINKSSVKNPLRVFLNGPAEHLCDAVKRSDSKARENVIVYTYGIKNINMQSGKGACNMTELLKLKPTTVKHVNFAEGSFKLTGKYTDVAWFKNSQDDAINWIYKRLPYANPDVADLTDAGTIWAVLMNDPSPSLQKYGNFFEANAHITPALPQPSTGMPAKDVRTLKKVLADQCYARVWNSRESEMGRDKWSAQRASGSTHDPAFDQRAFYNANGPKGVPAAQIMSYGDKKAAVFLHYKQVAQSASTSTVMKRSIPSGQWFILIT